MNIFVQSFLRSGQRISLEVEPSDSIESVRLKMQDAEGVNPALTELFYNNVFLEDGRTLSDYSVQSNSYIQSSNNISTLATKELKQIAKLNLAALKRAADGNLRSEYDLTSLPTQYDDNALIDNPNTTGLLTGRPWVFTFYEAFGTITPLETTQYVNNNIIYAYSSTFDVPDPQNARVVVDDVEVLNVGDGTERGHHLVVLDTDGVVVSTARYDTFETVPESGDGGAPGRIALTAALNAVTSGNTVILVVYDASSLDPDLRSAINTGYGSTNTETWGASRASHIFIGVKI